MKNLTFFGWFLLFLLYSSCGWLIEVVKTRIDDKKWVNRGFLIGPYCPIYGYAAVIMAVYLANYKKDIFTVFILALFICSFVEYITSYFMEKIFKTRWWDYSQERFNLEGRICLKNCVYFGLLGVLLVYIINPLLVNIILNMNNSYLNIIGFISLIWFVFDNLLSFWLINKVKGNNYNKRKDMTEDLNKEMKNILKREMKKLQKRIIKAFPDLKPIIKKN